MGVEGRAARRPRFNEFNTLQGGHFRLVTLGALALERSDGEVNEGLASLNARRRKVALLAVLSLARRGVSRDSLIEMFWGDQDEARARHSLSDAVSHLRRVIGRESIVATRSEIALAPEAPLVVDAVELAAATEERIIALYTGPFLAGVHLEDASTFEQWVTRERTRLEQLVVRAASAQCRAHMEAGQPAACRDVAERWLDTEPLSAEAGVAYLESLAGAGEGDARALAAYERLCARLRREYELEPDPAVSAVARRIEARRRERAVEIAHAVAVEQVPQPSPRPAPARPWSPYRGAGLIAAAVAAIVFVAGAARFTASPPPCPAPTVVAIATIEPAASDTIPSLADGRSRIIGAKIVGIVDSTTWWTCGAPSWSSSRGGG